MFSRYFLPLFTVCIYLSLSGCTSIPAAESPTKQPSSDQQAWTINYERSGGIVGLAQSATFGADGSRSLSNFDKPAQTLEPLAPSALTHLSNLVTLASKEQPSQATKKQKNCADCLHESVRLQSEGSVVYYSNNAPLPDAQKELLRFLAEHTPMR